MKVPEQHFLMTLFVMLGCLTEEEGNDLKTAAKTDLSKILYYI